MPTDFSSRRVWRAARGVHLRFFFLFDDSVILFDKAAVVISLGAVRETFFDRQLAGFSMKVRKCMHGFLLTSKNYLEKFGRYGNMLAAW